jgi:hypothetical protein
MMGYHLSWDRRWGHDRRRQDKAQVQGTCTRYDITYVSWIGGTSREAIPHVPGQSNVTAKNPIANHL